MAEFGERRHEVVGAAAQQRHRPPGGVAPMPIQAPFTHRAECAQSYNRSSLLQHAPAIERLRGWVVGETTVG